MEGKTSEHLGAVLLSISTTSFPVSKLTKEAFIFDFDLSKSDARIDIVWSFLKS